MAIVKLNQKLQRLETQAFETDNQIVFRYFDSLKSDDRDDHFYKALYIGVLALMEDRLSAFLAKTANELGTELENLKMIFDMKKEMFFKSAVKGVLAEEEIAKFLNELLSSKKLKDRVELTGNIQGSIPKNKTGDIISYVDGDDALRIVIECKFDKSIKLGEISKKEIFTNKTDTVWSQLIEAQANRDGKVSILVLDNSLIDGTVLNAVDGVKFIPEIGLVAVIDSQSGNFSNLTTAYFLARDIAMNAKKLDLDKDLLSILVNRMIKDIEDVGAIRKMVEGNISNNVKILQQIEKSYLSIYFTRDYLMKFLQDGVLSKKDLFDFYSGDEIRDAYKTIEKNITADLD